MRQVPLFRLLFTIVFSLLCSSHALAKFDGLTQRSINGTSETLPEGNVELGFTTFSYGITDDLMISVPTLPLVFGQISVGAKYKVSLNSNFRFSPEAQVGTYQMTGATYAAGGFSLGLDLPNSRSTIDLGAGFARMRDKTNLALFKSNSTDKDADNIVIVTAVTGKVEFNHYTSGGNLFYLGANTIAPIYLGFTWAWENVHFGIISSLNSVFIPLPYIYVRF